MMDLLSIVPYYDGHLCAALAQEDGVRIQLGAITYQYDRTYFRREGIQNEPGLLDVVSSLKLARSIVRPLKVTEGLVNLMALLVRFLVSRPDVLHVQFIPLVTYVPFELWFMRAARALGIKVVYTVHDMLPPNTGDRYKAVYSSIYRFSDALICHDARAKDRLVREFDIAPGRVRVIPHGPFFASRSKLTRQEARIKLGVPLEECLVLWQGIVEPYKGVSFLLQAWQQVCARGLKARLAVVGNSRKEVLQSIRNEVADLGIARSVLLDLRFVSVEELEAWYCAADVLTYPYSESTTSGALMTGINYGKPIVATTLAPFQQILRHGDNALLVEYGDVDALSRELECLISDQQLRRKIGDRVRESQVNGPQWADIAANTRKCYEDVIRGSSVPVDRN